MVATRRSAKEKAAAKPRPTKPRPPSRTKKPVAKAERGPNRLCALPPEVFAACVAPLAPDAAAYLSSTSKDTREKLASPAGAAALRTVVERTFSLKGLTLGAGESAGVRELLFVASICHDWTRHHFNTQDLVQPQDLVQRLPGAEIPAAIARGALTAGLDDEGFFKGTSAAFRERAATLLGATCQFVHAKKSYKVKDFDYDGRDEPPMLDVVRRGGRRYAGDRDVTDYDLRSDEDVEQGGQTTVVLGDGAVFATLTFELSLDWGGSYFEGHLTSIIHINIGGIGGGDSHQCLWSVSKGYGDDDEEAEYTLSASVAARISDALGLPGDREDRDAVLGLLFYVLAAPFRWEPVVNHEVRSGPGGNTLFFLLRRHALVAARLVSFDATTVSIGGGGVTLAPLARAPRGIRFHSGGPDGKGYGWWLRSQPPRSKRGLSGGRVTTL